MKKTKPTHGGARKRSGAPSKYGEPTENITIRVPVSRKQAVREVVAEYLQQFVVESKRGDVVTTYDETGWGKQWIVSPNYIDLLLSGGSMIVKFSDGVSLPNPMEMTDGTRIVHCSVKKLEDFKGALYFIEKTTIKKSKS